MSKQHHFLISFAASGGRFGHRCFRRNRKEFRHMELLTAMTEELGHLDYVILAVNYLGYYEVTE